MYEAMENLLDEKAAERKWQDRERIGFKKWSFISNKETVTIVYLEANHFLKKHLDPWSALS